MDGVIHNTPARSLKPVGLMSMCWNLANFMESSPILAWNKGEKMSSFLNPDTILEAN